MYGRVRSQTRVTRRRRYRLHFVVAHCVGFETYKSVEVHPDVCTLQRPLFCRQLVGARMLAGVRVLVCQSVVIRSAAPVCNSSIIQRMHQDSRVSLSGRAVPCVLRAAPDLRRAATATNVTRRLPVDCTPNRSD